MFLVNRGFQLRERGLLAENNARYDGWHLIYEGAPVSVRLDYYEMEFVVTLSKGPVAASYFLLDKRLFAGASGISGSSFHVSALGEAMAGIARDLAVNYRAILDGADDSWSRIRELAEAHARASQAESERLTIEYSTGPARREAAVAFKEKRYLDVVRLLGPHKAILAPSELQKLEFSRKRIPAWRRWIS